MPKSRFIEADRLRPLIAYCAAAFVAVLLVGVLVPAGTSRTLLVAAWLFLFPVGAWRLLTGRRRG